MKLLNGFANDPAVLCMLILSCTSEVYVLYVSTAIVNLGQCKMYRATRGLSRR